MVIVTVQLEQKTASVRVQGTNSMPPLNLEDYARTMIVAAFVGTVDPQSWVLHDTTRHDGDKAMTFHFQISTPQGAKG